MGDRVAKHTKPNAMREKADRPAHRVNTQEPFRKADDVIQRLIGV
jgi:hypothetical protein